MSDIDLLADAREWLADQAIGERLQTHSDKCHLWHPACLVARLVREVERHREAIRRLADQDATLSVVGGNVTVTVDATLTDAEREAIQEALAGAEQDARLFGDKDAAADAVALRGLLRRLG